MELYINSTLVDINERLPFPLTFQISDIRNIDVRKGSSSKTITLPGTRKNCELFATTYALTTTSTTDIDVETSLQNFDPSIKANARYYQNGLLQFEGLAQLISCVKNNGVWSFEVILFAEQIDIFTLLKNYKLRELGWSEYDHDLTYTNQQNSWSGSIIKSGSPYNNYSGVNWLGEGYYYGLIDYGFDRPSDTAFGVEHIPPQIFVKSIVDKMFNQIGVTYTSDFFDTQRFKKLLLAYEGGEFPSIDSATAASYSIETDQKNNTNGYILEQDDYATFQTSYDILAGTGRRLIYPNNIIDYNSNDASDVDPSSQIQTHLPLNIVIANEGEYTLTYQGTHNVNLDFTLTGGSGSSNVVINTICKLVILKNNQTYQEDIIWYNNINGTSLTNSFNAAFASTFNLSLVPSDVLTFKLIVENNNSYVQDSTATNATYDFNIAASSCQLDLAYDVQQIIPGSEVSLKQFLPDMDCGTFFKGLINMFNLIVKPDADNPRKIDIEPLDDFYNGTDTAIDWTHKVDYSKEFRVTPTINLSSKKYIYEFQDDKDYWNNRYFEDVTKQYGAKTIISGSQYATQETKITLPFSNKVIQQIPETDLILPRCYNVKSDQGINEITPKRGKPFIVQIKDGNVGTLQTADWIHIDEGGTDNNETSYPYVGHLDDIDTPSFDLMFQIPSYVFYNVPSGINYTTNNLYTYHEKFIKELVDKNGKMLTCYVNLNPEDINKLDFADLILINGVAYRLQKIVDYNSQTQASTKCELIRLIEGSNIQTYTDVVVDEDPYIPPSLVYRMTEEGLIRKVEENFTRGLE